MPDIAHGPGDSGLQGSYGLCHFRASIMQRRSHITDKKIKCNKVIFEKYHKGKMSLW